MPEARHRLLRWAEIDAAGRLALGPGLDGIFFEASNTRSFAGEAARAEFRERWLGRFLRLDPREAFVALGADGRCIGYLIGCLADPAITPRFADIGYFPLLADLTAHYPAHLHVNMAPEARDQGIGSRLIEAFADHAADSGVPGMHVVTGEGLRNVGFYLKCGFTTVRVFPWNGRSLVMLARALPRRAASAPAGPSL